MSAASASSNSASRLTPVGDVSQELASCVSGFRSEVDRAAAEEVDEVLANIGARIVAMTDGDVVRAMRGMAPMTARSLRSIFWRGDGQLPRATVEEHIQAVCEACGAAYYALRAPPPPAQR